MEAPKLSLSNQILSNVFNKNSIGVVGSAVASHYGIEFVEKIFQDLGYNDVPKFIIYIITTLLGFSAGYSSALSLDGVRWKILRYLYGYQNWIRQPKSFKTKLWGLTVKALLGPNNYGTFDLQSVLPRLPLPELEDTCQKYLMTVKPLVSAAEYEETKKLVEQFRDGEGKILQKFLEKKIKEEDNWLSKWWIDYNYLQNRDPIAINVNFFMTGTLKPEIKCKPNARIATVLHTVVKYAELIEQNRLQPDIIMGVIPVCMDGAYYMFGTCRIPGPEIDTLVKNKDAKHCVVIAYGQYYRLDLYAPDKKTGKLRSLTKLELRKQLDIIEEAAKDNNYLEDIKPVASLTGLPRSEWASRRIKLQEKNAATLEEIESSLFMVFLSDHKRFDNISDQSHAALCGDGYHRWFDKGITVGGFGHSIQGGANMEHTGADATHYVLLWERVLIYERYSPDGDVLTLGEPEPRTLPPPKPLEWNLDYMESDITYAYNHLMTMGDNMDVFSLHCPIGKGEIKKLGYSPDAFVQMAIQLAYYRMNGQLAKTYEPASTRLFLLGRTENINPVTELSVDFVRKMDDQSMTAKEKKQALVKAIDLQKKKNIESTLGYGSDRHMLGLLLAARELGRDTPLVFRNEAYKLPMNLSTSQTPTVIGTLGLPLIEETMGGGFGPASHDGYGILYIVIGEHLLNFNITSWRTCESTDSKKFADVLIEAMGDMRSLLQKAQL
ncbi:unnamed protein product [Dimorphilus gyrociliatus]|uniref:Choline/carnitine acyltransferase domain-containing protein n=1 Tax=Dimorphilus gyrociliatus TaxID=2664684 RepID=A0A7I8W1G7_9ANNE|nr:unnamed protein product [Dimorphilus gyrociliatus]